MAEKSETMLDKSQINVLSSERSELSHCVVSNKGYAQDNIALHSSNYSLYNEAIIGPRWYSSTKCGV